MIISSFFTIPVMQTQLDFDLQKLTEFTFQIQNKDKKGVQVSNRGGWQSSDISEENHEEFVKLKKEINQYVQIYQSEVFKGMIFEENMKLITSSMWLNINEKNHYNEMHIHGYSTLSGAYYIKHDGLKNGDIIFKNPKGLYMSLAHWPMGMVKKTNDVTSQYISITPKSNMLILFPAWIDHKVASNLKNDSRISLSFNVQPILEKKL